MENERQALQVLGRYITQDIRDSRIVEKYVRSFMFKICARSRFRSSYVSLAISLSE
jgi:hypothetical protein